MKHLLTTLLLFFLLHNLLIARGGVVKTAGGDDDPKGVLCGGVERWAVKVLTDAAAAQVNYTPRPTTLDSLIHIATTPSTTAPRMAGIEFQNYTIACRITIKKNEDDNDYHLVLSSGSETMVGEVPDPVCAVASTSAHVNDFIDARNWVNTHIGTGAVANVNIPAVDITGVAYVDVPHGQTGASPNQMEIHPILNIQFSVTTGSAETGSREPAFRVSVTPSVFTESTIFRLVSDHGMFGKCRLELYSMSGIRVTEQEIPCENSKEVNYPFHRNGLADGTYIFRILNCGSILYEGKIILE